MQDLRTLCRQYAERKPDWAQSMPGVACRDNCGNQWRRAALAALGE